LHHFLFLFFFFFLFFLFLVPSFCCLLFAYWRPYLLHFPTPHACAPQGSPRRTCVAHVVVSTASFGLIRYTSSITDPDVATTKHFSPDTSLTSYRGGALLQRLKSNNYRCFTLCFGFIAMNFYCYYGL
jgi:hypothetical protein